MATNFDFDGSFNDDTEPQNIEEVQEAEERSAPRRNPLRLVLLVLLILVLLCVVCFLASRTFGLPIPGFGSGPAPSEPAPEPTQEPVPTDVAEAPVEETTEPDTGEEEVPEGEPPATDEAVEEEEPAPETTEEPAPDDSEEEVIDEHAEEDVEPDLGATATTEPVPGPTATPGPTVVVTVTNCDENTPPIADANGPYNAMMGKGQAFVTFDGSGSSDPDGTIIDYTWDFGDGSGPESSTDPTAVHGYTSEGSYEVTLTVLDDCGEQAQDTVEVTIVGPTPPANGDDSDDGNEATATPAPATPADPSSVTLGFCYRVQRGDTLSGIASFYGVPHFDLARVNNVSPEYFVIAGESLFVPTEPVKNGPNGYQVQAGDTFYSIAHQCDLPVNYLAQVNKANVDDTLTPGQVVILPLNR